MYKKFEMPKKTGHGPVSSVVQHTLSVREVWGSIPRLVELAQCRQRLATVATFLWSCVGQALNREDDPATRYTFRRNTASIMKIDRFSLSPSRLHTLFHVFLSVIADLLIKDWILDRKLQFLGASSYLIFVHRVERNFSHFCISLSSSFNITKRQFDALQQSRLGSVT